MIESHDYGIQIVSTGVRSGVLDSEEDRLPSLYVASPPEFGGPEGVWSPEHLLVASVASCLMTTFRAMAENSKLEVKEYTDDALGHLQRGEARLYSIDRITLRPKVVIASDDDLEKAEKLLKKAEEVCLVSRSVNSDISMDAQVLVAHKVAR